MLMATWSCHHHSHDQYTAFVDPLIGTDGHGHTFPGATVPFGMVQLSPDTRKDSWDGCSGYHYSDSTILGFSHTHLSGTGVGDYGDVRFMPMTGELKVNPGVEDDSRTGYRSRFSHQNEAAKPGYYQVFLEDYAINVELTATNRCGFHKYTLPVNEPVSIIIDLFESVTSDIILESAVEIIDEDEISGFRRTKGWAEDQVIYFHAVFSEPFFSCGIVENGEPDTNRLAAEGKNLKAFVNYKDREWEVLMIKVGISAVSRDGAKGNLLHEIPGWDFEKAAKKARTSWEDELSKMEVVKGKREDKIKFYTALYHTMISPNLFMDHDGSYRGHDGKIHHAVDNEIYTVFSLWDTYRALHPLMTILQPEKTGYFINTMLDIYDKRGLLPVWELAGNETYCMIGYHAVPVILDAVMKGYHGFDLEKAFDAMKNSANADHFGLKYYRENGYIPADAEGESVSKTLEYAYDDWCIAQMARFLGKEGDYASFIQRAQYYKNLFDPETGFIRGKRNSTFVSPFDPAEVNFMLTEANTWQYTFYVPQDIAGLTKLAGGNEAFSSRLDQMFSSNSALAGREQADITGLIGQYAHGNEPSHHMAYLYNYVGEPHKTQKITRQIAEELYGIGPDGLCGNEDCGQMSAWFVFAATGFYPVTPGDNTYIIGSPLFEELLIHLPGKKKFRIMALNNSRENIYIQSASLNREEFTRSFLYHDELMAGGDLVLNMGPLPSKTWGSGPENRPKSSIEDYLITPVPYYTAPGKTFRNNIQVGISHIFSDAVISYQIGRQDPGKNSPLYKDTIVGFESFEISAIASLDSLIPSLTARAGFKKMDNLWNIRIKHPYSSQYTGGGDLALVDGETGGANFRTGGWQGYEGVDFEVVIDLGRKRSVNKINARFLEDQNSWIFLPVEVEIGISDRPYDFKVIARINNPVKEAFSPSIAGFGRKDIGSTARYIKVRAKNIADCPSWHKGAGGKAWLFIDEVEIE